jgi:hypothetical protein
MSPERATTLVHKGAMPIAIHAIRTFRRHFTRSHRLEIHTDGSLDESDHEVLLKAAEGMAAGIVTPADRKPIVEVSLANYPKTRGLLGRGAYFTKLELPIFAKGPYFYFDSDIVWLRHVTNLVPLHRPNAFSTESWSWYHGVSNDRQWIGAQTPQRVNSGFYHIGEPFPYQRMEEMLEQRMFDPTIPYNSDQEIMAYLFHDMELYHPEDLKRSRVGRVYNLSAETCAALHFPGRMWVPHMDQIEALDSIASPAEAHIRYQQPVPLSFSELFRMRLHMRLANSKLARLPIWLFRKVRFFAGR